MPVLLSMPNKAIHPLDTLAIQWKAEDEAFFLDVPFSDDYVVLSNPIGTRSSWAIKSHEIGKSSNLESIYDKHFRGPRRRKTVPLMEMFSDMFRASTFGPEELDLGTVIINSDYKLIDCFGEIGIIKRSGWVVSQKLLGLLKQFNIGEYKTYKIQVYHKGKNYDNYVYFHFHNYADKLVDYTRSTFYIQEGYLGRNRQVTEISSEEEFKTKTAPCFFIQKSFF